MEKIKIKLFLGLVGLIIALFFTSCEKEVVYYEKYYFEEQSQNIVDSRGNSSDRNSGTSTTKNYLSSSVLQPALTPPANPSWIKVGEIKSAGNITLSNISKNSWRTVNLTFTFLGDGASFVEYALFQIPGKQEIRVEVVDNKFSITDIRIPMNTYLDIKLSYQTKASLPSSLKEGDLITLSLSGFSTDEPKVNLPSSGTMPKNINLDRVSLKNDGSVNPNPNPDPDPDPETPAKNVYFQNNIHFHSAGQTYLGVGEEREIILTWFQFYLISGPVKITNLTLKNPYLNSGLEFGEIRISLNGGERFKISSTISKDKTSSTLDLSSLAINAGGGWQDITIFASVKNIRNSAFNTETFGFEILNRNDLEFQNSKGEKISLSLVNIFQDGKMLD